MKKICLIIIMLISVLDTSKAQANTSAIYSLTRDKSYMQIRYGKTAKVCKDLKIKRIEKNKRKIEKSIDINY